MITKTQAYALDALLQETIVDDNWHRVSFLTRRGDPGQYLISDFQVARAIYRVPPNDIASQPRWLRALVYLYGAGMVTLVVLLAFRILSVG